MNPGIFLASQEGSFLIDMVFVSGIFLTLGLHRQDGNIAGKPQGLQCWGNLTKFRENMQ
jgi:hypothetical protein